MRGTGKEKWGRAKSRWAEGPAEPQWPQRVFVAHTYPPPGSVPGTALLGTGDAALNVAGMELGVGCGGGWWLILGRGELRRRRKAGKRK